MCYELTKNGLPANVEFNDDDFNRPLQGAEGKVVILLTNLHNDVNVSPLLPSHTKGKVKDDMSSGTIVRTADVSHLE